MVQLVMGLEEEFGIAIPDDACQPLRDFTVGALTGWLEPQLTARPALFA
jgi:acyl carrier protein